jgi:hypothetical protein
MPGCQYSARTACEFSVAVEISSEVSPAGDFPRAAWDFALGACNFCWSSEIRHGASEIEVEEIRRSASYFSRGVPDVSDGDRNWSRSARLFFEAAERLRTAELFSAPGSCGYCK